MYVFEAVTMYLLTGKSLQVQWMRVFVSRFLTTTRDFSEIQRRILLIMIICGILLINLISFWEKLK